MKPAPTCETWQPIETGKYKDEHGRVWFCVVRDRDVVCTSRVSWTSAYHETFRKWGWTPVDPSPPGANNER